MKKIIIVATFLLVVVIACKKKTTNTTTQIADGSSAPVLPSEPYDYSDKNGGTNNDVVTLGRVLFYDKNLSFNNSLSCGSCHKQNKGFADDVQFHTGVLGNKLTRNTLAISGDGNNLFWDGRSSNINDLILKPISNHDEMLQDLSKLTDKLNKIEYYKTLALNAYHKETLDLDKINSAIAAFCKTLSPLNTTFINSFFNTNSNTLTESEKNGWQIFNSKAKCGSCHNVMNQFFYSSSFHNNGLDVTYADNGLSKISNTKESEGVFKTPNLANVALTAPYMHDGRFKTLEEVVEFYNSGVQPHKNLDFVLRDITFRELDSLENLMQFNNINGIFDEQSIIDFVNSKGPGRLNLTAKKKLI